MPDDAIATEVLPRLRAAIQILDTRNLHFQDVPASEAGNLALFLRSAEGWLTDPEGMRAVIDAGIRAGQSDNG